MAVHEIRIEVRPDAVPAIEDAFAEAEEAGLMVLEDRLAGRAWVVGYFPSDEAARTQWAPWAARSGAAWGAGAVEVKGLADQDWKDSYKIHFRATAFGPLHWVPVWERDTFVAPAGAHVLWLDPGLAFGTGNHETTRLVAERLVEFTARRGPVGRVVDAGCGSGILALSAVRLGFQDVVGFDNDPEAVRVSEENAALNTLAGRVDFRVGDLDTGWPAGPSELVLANIQADVLVRFAPALLAAVAPGGELVLSGILARERDDVRAAFARLAPAWPLDSRTQGEWSDLQLRRPV